MHVRGKVLSAEPGASGGTVYMLDVWCEDENGVKVTDGGAQGRGAGGAAGGPAAPR